MSLCKKIWLGVASLSLKFHALHHICIITIFSCIIDVCYICCNAVCWWVWIRLSPWWIYICMSHVHAFSCIRTFNSIYFVIFFVWYFFDCLLLFLSFSLSYVSCIMAPKRKSTLSRNPFRSGTSSSFSPSDPTPSLIQFRDEKANQTYFRTYYDAAFI